MGDISDVHARLVQLGGSFQAVRATLKSGVSMHELQDTVKLSSLMRFHRAAREARRSAQCCFASIRGRLVLSVNANLPSERTEHEHEPLR